jgi:hypothetical protein
MCQESRNDMVCACRRFLMASFALMMLCAGAVWGQASADPVKSGFQNPPNGARPRVWWHWMNGNITQEGITADLQWMKKVGLGGYQNFDAALQTPQVVPKRLAYMTPEWKEAFRHAILLGGQLGFEMAIAGSPGWSESGGPWVPGSEGMKKYVWSETLVHGGQPFSGTLAKPPSNSGAFQNEGIHDQPTPGAAPIPNYYKDTVVIAYKRPAGDKSVEELQAKISASGGSPEFAMLTDGDLEKTTKLPIPAEGQASWIQYEFPQPQTIRAVSFVMKRFDEITALVAGMGAPDKVLEASDDGQNFREVARLNSDDDPPQSTVSIPAVTAKYFRVSFKRTPPPPIPDWAQGLDPESFGIKIPPKPTDFEIAELVLHAGARVNQFEEKAAFIPVPDLYHYRRQARLDSPRWRLGRASLWLLAAGNQQPSRHCRSHGPRSRQDGPALREELLREVPRQLQADGGR